MNGRLTGYGYRYPIAALQNNTLAATVNDQDSNPEVCAYVYKLSNNNHPDNNNKSVSNKTEDRWKKVATLKTRGVPMTDDQYHQAISVQDGHIFTGRADFGRGYGTVFVHKMN